MEPAWAAVMVGGVVGTFTIIGVVIAVRTYVESTNERKVSQARLVWAVVAGHVGKAKGARAGDMGKSTLDESLGHENSSLLGDKPDYYEARVEDPEPYSIMTRDVTIFGVRITNNSDEPIGRCRIQLEGSKDVGREPAEQRTIAERTWKHHHPRYAARVLPPRTSRSFRVVVPVSYSEINMLAARVVVHFTDSAGHRWSRTDTKTPTLVPKPPSSRWQPVRAWWDRNR